VVFQAELERWLTSEAWRAVAGRLGLSPREREVVESVMADRSDRAIGMALGISRHTVHTHLERVYRKLGVSSRTELFRCVVGCYLALASDPGSPVPPNCERFRDGRCPFGR